MTVIVVALVALAVLGLLALVHRWLWVRLVRDTTRSGGVARRTGTALTFALPLAAVAALVAGRAGVPFPLQQAVAWPGFMWLAVLLYLSLAMLVGEVVRAVWLRRVTPPAARVPVPVSAPASAQASAPASAPVDPAAEPDPSAPADRAPAADPAAEPAPARESAFDAAVLTRRRFVARTVGGAAAAAALATVGYGTYGVLRGPRVKRVRVPLAKLPRAAHGFRIAVVSDVHLGPILGAAHTRRVVDAVNGTQPDLIAVVGDLVDGSVPDLGRAAEPLRGLRARHGSFFVTGNHEYFSGAEQWVDHVRELGMQPLENARRALPYFDLAGVNDVAGESEGHGPDFRAALGDRDRSRTAVLLAHQPIVIHDAVRHGVDLQLSGHTHGGQLWPGNYLAELANPTVAGLERYGDTQLYVSRGAGAWGPPVRVGAPSDITVVELASYQA
ncbi:metallophosphoesterase [Streptomyces sp. NBC_00513]|uniref:metallophosphoesterase n=1 Tax=unclassified Streptomyces TaxID=2593676 RepID=UPI00224D9C6D|nr:metallophosphoesterase [Streptomyces sp. NBC_00424]MCX5073762.1 metallophosphoesterase [Streptomyces sp. NBC_00424]WUD43013.1 metallophosphoesterase [Streptomyces sp. NBC_00513]